MVVGPRETCRELDRVGSKITGAHENLAFHRSGFANQRRSVAICRARREKTRLRQLDRNTGPRPVRFPNAVLDKTADATGGLAA
jgi:hypothetical protein